MAGKVVFTALGWTYIGLTAGWTCILLGGMMFLHLNRHLPYLQMRRLPLVFAAIASLHLYGAMVMTLYTILPLFTCNTEFWIMSTYLPFGIALFHAANSQFLHIATIQKKYAHLENFQYGALIKQLRGGSDQSNRWRRFKGRVWGNQVDRMMFFIIVGLVIQFGLTVLVFFGSKKFHPGYGFFGTTLDGVGVWRRSQCTKGWEWWLSIAWQFFWAWIYAPYILWKSRHIHDVNGWRVQTICCCLVGLPASPLWLAGVYAPGMAVVNKYIIPPQWFSFWIFFIEIFTIIVPCWQVIRSRSLQKETLDAITSWEKRTQSSHARPFEVESVDTFSHNSTQYSGSTLQVSKSSTTANSLDKSRTAIFGMPAMENTLKTDADAFLRFAALKDFSGENVSFLINVALWKAAWSSRSTLSADEIRRQQFIAAIRIYASFASMDFSEFPVNLSCQESKHLHDMFESPAMMLCGGRNSENRSTPFDFISSAASSTADFKTGLNLDTLGKANFESVQKMRKMEDGSLWDHEIPSTFGIDAFDTAEHEIKYLVFTNTWPKFVNHTYVEKADRSVSGMYTQRLFHYFRLT